MNTYYNSGAGLQIAIGKMDVFNFALYQNHIAPIQRITLENGTGDPLDGLILRIYSDFNFFRPYEAPLPSVPSGKPVRIADPALQINGSALAELTEAVNALITVEVCSGEQVLCGCRGEIQVFAYDQWQGGASYRDLLPSFVLPNHPVIPVLLHDAAECLKKWGKSCALDGYQSKDPNRVRDLAAAAYAAVQKKNIFYAEPPASFGVPGQRIRTPESMMEQRLGTCMDMTLLYAACLEAMGLHPLLVMMDGHIFAGVWLRQRTPEEIKSGSVTIENLKQLTMRIDNGSDELTFVECTCMCAGRQESFEEAERTAKQRRLTDIENFRYAIDVYASRQYGVKPIAYRISDGGRYRIDFEDKAEEELTAAPKALDISVSGPAVKKAEKIMNKRELWESKLLDLSLRNMLLNLPRNASVEPVMSSHVDELEDALADGHEFRLLPVPEWLNDIVINEPVRAGDALDAGDASDAEHALNAEHTLDAGQPKQPKQWLPEEMKKSSVFEITKWPSGEDHDISEKLRHEFRNHRLYTFCNEKQLEKELTSLYRAARASQLENGVSSLYLAIGLLKWYAPEEEKPCYAPLVLLPIEIVRKSVNQGYALHSRDEDPHFNTTLAEMLKQNYDLEIGGLDPLPADEHGINIRRVFSIVRSALYPMKNWDVVESCVIGNFSFAQFAIWNDIHTAGDVLDSSKIVRSLMKSHVDWNIDAREDVPEEKVYIPLPLDSTQLQAVKMAAGGSTFVLHGPPGTGKSQTITAMIANLIARKKTVLFVAEKMAALSVVEKKLTSLGIGEFCLELHSNKATKKQVLSQLGKALEAKAPAVQTNYRILHERNTGIRSRLDRYAGHLHRVHPCGYSLHELIDRYESVGPVRQRIDFDPEFVGRISREMVLGHDTAISGLKAAGSEIYDFVSTPLRGVYLSDYNAEVRRQVLPAVGEYQAALQAVRDGASAVNACFRQGGPVTVRELTELKELLEVYREGSEIDPLYLRILNGDMREAEDFYLRQDALQQEERAMLARWSPEFLASDMQVWREKHAAAGKKFFGKHGAMAAVTEEIQSFAKIRVVYEQIPSLLDEVARYQNNAAALQNFRQLLSQDTREMLEAMPAREDYRRAAQSAGALQARTEQFPGGLVGIMTAARNRDVDETFRNYLTQYEAYDRARNRLNSLLDRDASKTGEERLEEELSFCSYLRNDPATLKDWALYNQARAGCMRAGLKPVVEAYESGMPAEELLPAYRKGFTYALINSIINSDDVLSTFSGATFNETIQQFRQLDDALMAETRAEIRQKLAANVPSAIESPETGIELTVLRKAIGSNARGVSIRVLFEKIPHILKRLTPCMLMSPNSAAQYLAQRNDLFDVVIFDEASQLPTCKATSALMRAENAVIVGDPKQMPPTTFFAAGGPEVDDIVLEDLDSVLDDVLALGVPSQYLQWHYRSRHESLIAFSNHEFYENRMFTFPSANDRERRVKAIHVDGSVYEKGTNPKEAQAIVSDILRRYRDPELKKQTVGVVTFNVKQQALIDNLLMEEFEKDPSFDYWANGGEDPLFIKNLETVQGDERDVILFSIGYGPDERGNISMNFGPINKEGGGKRLNVAFTRSRIEMCIFASMYASDIRVTDNSPEGLRAFHDFLYYAEGHGLIGAGWASRREHSEDGVLKSICDAIREQGYQCETMIGHSDFRVDIAVIDPCEPTEYLLGIMLDGESYRRTGYTRDREISQIGVLNGLGWQIRRIWTVDWWDNRGKELRGLMAELDALREQSRIRAEEKEQRRIEEEARAREEAMQALAAEADGISALPEVSDEVQSTS